MPNPIGPKVSTSSPMPAEELNRPPLLRHIDFFDKNKNGKLTISEIADGLERMGYGKLKANAMAFGTVLVRGPKTTGKHDFQINIESAMKSEQAGSTHLYNPDGTVDMNKVEGFIKALNPGNKERLTMDDFKAYGKKLAAEHVPGDGIKVKAQRLKQEEQFKIAWSGIFNLAGHDGPDKKKYLTNDDLRWFYDGSLFYRRAAEVEAQKEQKSAKGWSPK